MKRFYMILAYDSRTHDQSPGWSHHMDVFARNLVIPEGFYEERFNILYRRWRLGSNHCKPLVVKRAL